MKSPTQRFGTLRSLRAAFPLLPARLFLLTLFFRAAATSEQEAFLSVITAPPGLEVWLGDSYIGDSPISGKKVPAGQYSLRIIDQVRHLTVTDEVQLVGGENTVVKKQVSGKFASLRVQTDPSGALVSIVTPLGTTPLANGFMMPGKYRLEIQHPSEHYLPHAEEVTLARGETLNLAEQLQRTSPFDRKALLRLILGVGAVAGFVWAIVEEGDHRTKMEQAKNLSGDERTQLADEASTSRALRNVAIMLGGACTLALEVVAFF